MQLEKEGAPETASELYTSSGRRQWLGMLGAGGTRQCLPPMPVWAGDFLALLVPVGGKD